MSSPVILSPYQNAWKTRFEQLRSILREALGGLALDIEHIGSTAVPGLDAKPIIDLDVVISRTTDFDEIQTRLAGIGYRHVGDRGVPGREAFDRVVEDGGAPPDHHLYVCRENARELGRHIAFRDALLRDPEICAEYARLKHRLAASHRDDREAYTGGKTRFVEEVLARFERGD